MTRCKYDVYLAGAMHGRPVPEVLAERIRAKQLCDWYGLTYYDPAADEGLHGKASISLAPSDVDMRWYVYKDDCAIDRCHVLLNLTGDVSSSGTGWEMGRMLYKNKRLVVVVAPQLASGQKRNFTSIKAHVTASLYEAVSYITLLKRGHYATFRPRRNVEH